MAKKKGGKKKGDDGGGGGGKKKGKALAKVSFNTRMKDFKARLSRQVELCETLEEENRVYRSLFEKEVSDKDDIVDYLERSLKDSCVEITELEERLLGLQNAKNIEQNSYEEKLQNLTDESAQTKEKLTAENMALNGKLALVEEFRLQKDGILAKLADAEQEVVEQSKKFKSQLRAIELQNIKDREMLKKEMSERVENLAAAFRKAADKQLSYTVKQAIDETVRANWQLKKTSDMALSITDTNLRLKERETDLKQEMQIREAIERQLSSKAQGQEKVITLLQDKCEMQQQKMVEFEKLKENYESQQKAMSQLQCELSGALDEIKYIKKEKDDLESQVDKMEEELADRSATNKQLVSIIQTAEKVIKREMMTSLQVTEDEPPKREKIIEQLLILLDVASNLKEEGPFFPTASKDFFAKLDAEYSDVMYEEMIFYEPGNLSVLRKAGPSSESSEVETQLASGSEVRSIASRAVDYEKKPKNMFKDTAAKILSDIGLLNKFMKQRQ